jgi:hypothetical protein
VALRETRLCTHLQQHLKWLSSSCYSRCAVLTVDPSRDPGAVHQPPAVH